MGALAERKSGRRLSRCRMEKARVAAVLTMGIFLLVACVYIDSGKLQDGAQDIALEEALVKDDPPAKTTDDAKKDNKKPTKEPATKKPAAASDAKNEDTKKPAAAVDTKKDDTKAADKPGPDA